MNLKKDFGKIETDTYCLPERNTKNYPVGNSVELAFKN